MLLEAKMDVVRAFYRDARLVQAKFENHADGWRGVRGLTKLRHSHTMPRAVWPFPPVHEEERIADEISHTGIALRGTDCSRHFAYVRPANGTGGAGRATGAKTGREGSRAGQRG